MKVRKDRSIFLWYRGDREVTSLSKLSKALKVSSSLSTARGRIVNNGERALRFEELEKLYYNLRHKQAPSPYQLIERILAEQSTRMNMQADAVIRRCASTSRVTSRELVKHQDDCIIPLYGA